MGTSALSPYSNPFMPRLSDFPGRAATAHPLSSGAAPGRKSAGVEPNQAQSLKDAFDQVVYRSLETRQAMSLQLSSTQVQLGQGDGAAAVSGESFQFTFDFFEETRYEELALFQRRTDSTAEGLDGARQSAFYAAKEELSMRFAVSITISGAALAGFASTAEGAKDSNELMDRLMEITQKLLGESDELASDFFALLDGGDGEFNAQSMEEMFNEFMSSFLGALSGETGGLFPGLNLGQLGAPGQGGNTLMASGAQLEFKFEFSASVSVSQTTVQQGDPIVFDLDGDGIELTTYQKGARFDLMGTGRAQQAAFVNGGDAFLALDRNKDGLINSGLELFGEQHGARNGFEELRRFDLNGDGTINRHDAVFNELRLFRDNGDGKTDAGELISLIEAGIDEIFLDYQDVDEKAAGGNRLTQISAYLKNDGSRGRVADALLNYIA